jgi:hypothetical protein
MENQQEKKKKLLLVLPLLVLPFLALAFYALGGGGGYTSDTQQNVKQGFNTNLPDATFKKGDPQDKLSLYEQAGRNFDKEDALTAPDSIRQHTNGTRFPDLKTADPNEQRINDRLALVSKEINKPVNNQPITTTPKPEIGGDVDRLEKLMHNMQDKKADDPEMQQLSGMLDKIIAIQNPTPVQPKTVLESPSVKDTAFKAIPAVIEGNQKVAQGGVVKLRLLDTIHTKGLVIPKGQLLFGSCNITNQRLLLTIKTIRLGTAIVPVDLTVFSLDGLIGIDAPEAELGEAAGSGISNAVQNMQFLSVDQSLGVQAAGAGIDAAKNLLSKKVKRIKVKLKGGQSILLRNNQPDKH